MKQDRYLFSFSLLALCIALFCHDGRAQSIITGTFRQPNGTGITGYITVALIKPTVTNSCNTPSAVTTLQQITVAITNGTLGSLSLYPNSCLSIITPSSGTPSVFTGPAAGTGATIGVGRCGAVPCNVAGTFTLVTGTNPTSGVPYAFTTGSSNLGQSTLALLVLKTVNGNQPVCSLQPSSSNTNLAPIAYQFSIGQNTTSMTLVAGSTALAASTAYSWAYSCVQPYLVQVYSGSTLLYKTFWSVPNFSPVDASVIDATTNGYNIGAGVPFQTQP
jgi:hypothetical protein